MVSKNNKALIIDGLFDLQVWCLVLFYLSKILINLDIMNYFCFMTYNTFIKVFYDNIHGYRYLLVVRNS